MQGAVASVGTGEIPCGQAACQAWEQILAGGLSVFYRQAYRLLGNHADAEDAVQDALLAAYTHLDQFNGQSQMSTWVTAIVLNAARMQLRRRLQHVQVPLDEPIGEVQIPSLSEQFAEARPSPEDECRHAEFSTRLTRFHRRLSPTLRKTFQLRAIDGLSARETAEILGIPHGTVKTQFARARKKLREWIQRTLNPQSRGSRQRTGIAL